MVLTSLDSLHDEELLKIFSYLPFKSRISASCVCKRFRYLSLESLKSIKSVALLESRRKEWLYGYDVICKNYDLVLSVGFTELLYALSTFWRGINSLCLYKCSDVNDENIHLLADLPSLKTLCLTYVDVTDEGMSVLLLKNPNIKTLHLSKLPINGTLFSYIGDELKSLSLMGCYEVSDQALNRFAEARGSQIEHFMFEGPELKSCFLCRIANESSRLQTLCLDCTLKPSIEECFGCFHNLQSISLFFYEPTIDRWSLEHRRYVNTTKLCLQFAKIESIPLGSLLVMFPNIRELTIGFCSLESNLVDNLIDVLPEMKELQSLTLCSRNWPMCSSFADLATLNSNLRVKIGFLNEDQIYETVSSLRQVANQNRERIYSMELHAASWLKSQLVQLTLPENLLLSIKYQSSHLYYDIHERIFELD